MAHAQLNLADWRRKVAELYAEVRELAAEDPERTHRFSRAQRDRLFGRHPSSPLSVDQQRAVPGLSYCPYDPAWRLAAGVQAADPHTREIELPESTFQLTLAGHVEVPLATDRAWLDLFWIEGYGGGLFLPFLPFKDATNGNTTYGGARYLYDTIKGVDLGTAFDALVLDFNFAYHPLVRLQRRLDLSARAHGEHPASRRGSRRATDLSHSSAGSGAL